jgi:simple sugar transport system ATP-binding protein
MAAVASDPALELLGIEKSFGPVHANRGVTMAIPKGSIVGVIGENGAGKSTIMNIVYGLHQPDAGEIRVDGRAVTHESPRDAIANGIGMVHQHFMLVESFTVLENIILGAEQGALLKPSLTSARAELLRLEQEYGLKVDPDARIGDLPVGDQQRVEILKALYRGARILILDEPTAVLTPQETDQLFRILASLKAKGVTILLITHKLREVMAATDLVYVMRAGQVVAERATAATNREELAELMVGRKVRLKLDKAPAQPGAVVLSADHVGLTGAGGVALLKNIGFQLRAGEIVGVAGVSGNGQTELLEVLSGIRAPSSGSLSFGSRTITAEQALDAGQMRMLGLSHVPEDRHRYAMCSAFNAAETGVLGRHRDAPFNKNGVLDYPAMREHAATLMERYDVRPRRLEQRAVRFSGGNQQKLVIARETAVPPKILLVGQPTRGVDIGAIEFIHRQLVALRDAGCAILVVSVELDEVMALSDRILVMCAGRIVGEVPAAEADEKTLGLMMANIGKDEAA